MAHMLLLLLCGLIAISPLPARQREPVNRKEFSSVSMPGAYEVFVRGKATLSSGPAYNRYQFLLRREGGSAGEYYDSRFLADVQPITGEMAAFQRNFLGGVSAYISERAADIFGEFLQEIRFETVPGPEGATLYAMYVTLDDGAFPMRFVAAWRFEKSYVASFLGVDMGDGPDMKALVLEAAAAFQDHTAAPGTANPQVASTGAFTVDPGPWSLPVNNVLGLMNEYGLYYRPFRAAPGAGEAAIVWRNDLIEAAARKVAGKPEGPVYPSELAHIAKIEILSDAAQPGAYRFIAHGPYGQLTVDDVSLSFRPQTPLRDIDGLEYFRGARRLKLSLADVRDVSALRALDRVEYAFLSLSPEITDLSPMGGMQALRFLMMWNRDYSMVKDISFFGLLTRLETVYFHDSGISDAGVLARMPALTELHLVAADTLDKQPLINCERIEKLVLNRKPAR